MNDDVAISVKKLNKDFILPHQKKSSVKSVFTNMFSKGDKSYEVQHALKDISFEVKKGEFFGIVGRNGSGKSTLLKILAGIYQPTKGSVQTEGRIVPFIELGVGFNGELSGRENVYLNGALLGFSEKEVDDKYQDIVDFAEIERFMDQKLKNYSSGMQVRLAFSVATVLAESDILLIDEVLAVGDADFQRKCFDYFRQLKKLNKTVVFVSHDMNAVREYCERAILIDESKIIFEGSSSKTAEHYYEVFAEKETETKSSEDSRWGNKNAFYDKVSLSKNKLLNDDKELLLEVVITAKQDVEDVVAGFSLKNQAGNTLFGTNTHLLEQKKFSLKKGESIQIKWLMPNIFNSGTYYFDVALVQWESPVVFDSWSECIKLKVLRDKGTMYAVHPNVKLEVEK
jgi:ABC-2 type transport system ATP-binding protein